MVNVSDTPILLLVFNRPALTQKVFDIIKSIKPKHLYVAADGPRQGKEDDIIRCKETRDIIINGIDWACNLHTLFREQNLGCGYAVCSAISWFFEQVEEGIIFEDDCLPEASFFPFCAELLEYYRNNERIFLISGTNMQNGIKRGNASYYFSNYPITWGWASWRRAWKFFEYDIPNYDEAFKENKINHAFQSSSEKKYWRKKVKFGYTEKKYIWDYQWWFAIWKNKGLSIIPNSNLIVNLGFRNIGSHTFLYDSIREPACVKPINFPLIHPEKKIIDCEADKYTFNNAYSHSFQRFLRLVKENGIFGVLIYTFKKIFKKFTF